MMKRIFSLLLILSLSLSLFACKNRSDDTSDYKSVEEIPLPSYKKGQKVTLNVYNWGEYISDGEYDPETGEYAYDTNAEFEKYFNEHLSEKYGGIQISVEYSNYDNNEAMYSKLKNSAVSYDVIIPSDYMIEKLREDGMLLAFDTSNLSITDNENYGNIDESFKNAYYDLTNSYSVPYTYGMVGIIYNTTMVTEEDLERNNYGWGLLWDEKFAGNILQFNNPRDAFATAMYWKGLDVNSEDSKVWEQALELLKDQKELGIRYVNDEIFITMENESAAVATYYAGDFLTMADVQENLDFYYPSEGTNYFVDAMCIPTCSANPHLAKEYINFMIGEEAAVANATYIGYASPNNAVKNSEDYIDEMGEYAYDLLYNYTPESVNSYYNSLFDEGEVSPACYRYFTPEIQKQVNKLWEELKSHGTTEPWVHVTSVVIVAALLGYAGYTTYVKKKRSRDYRMRDKEKMLAKRAQNEKQSNQ